MNFSRKSIGFSNISSFSKVFEKTGSQESSSRHVSSNLGLAKLEMLENPMDFLEKSICQVGKAVW